ncbi:hypothetical protein, conserved [Trypanosoma brucei brucei TREU927]|uniref:Uncharacterized protein n=1 Tax=Trypanosoma brucei brucei (strain 927/4 GUTat10.1) TaxID=185431 RepID=Q585W5_TRYB2|nr:hypothetical protein, conserved [Trypanosoma brucei brucei TREU927]AAX80786.1 hypothetical protein, conserved [Trypanosoma brucei]AAZ11926.1 hypothetical protein, conserved [Trypanosoma brucei brucei TREU927]
MQGEENLKGATKCLAASPSEETVDPLAPPSPSSSTTSNRIHSVSEAERFYRSECARIGINVNNAFVKQLRAGSTVFNFDNGYLGERGIIPILTTLQRLSVASLSMRGCKLTAEDIAQMLQYLGFHETLQKIDLRDVPLSVSSGRKLFALALKNNCLTEILLDKDTPKYLSIQRQCFSNANMKLVASRCLVCNRAVIYSPDQRVEGQILLALSKALMNRGESYCEVALGVLFRTLLVCCDTNNGVLFICSYECKNKLSDDIVIMIESVLSEHLHGVKGTCPRNTTLQRCLVDNVARLERKRVNSEKLNAEGSTKVVNPLSSASSGATRCFDSSSADSSDAEEMHRKNHDDADACSVCGNHTLCLSNGAYRFLSQLHDDVTVDCYLRPSALLHLSRVMIKHQRFKPCSQLCVQHLVRFGLYSYGGVQVTNSMTGISLLSSLDIPLTQLSNDDFSIINFASAYIDDAAGEDTCCALTVASAMTDIEGVAIDPYMIYAVGRFLAKIPPTSLGMELRHACEVALMVGCLPVESAPFNRRKERPTRDFYYLWEKWCKVADMETLVRAAFSRRRQGLFIVDGPHSNLFDNTRAVLWAFRKMRRSILIVMRFCVEWLALPNGVIPNESPMGRSFHTTLKVVGQTNIHNTIYVICQSNFGENVGNRGFFYVPRSVFNLYVSSDACIFVDSNVFALSNGEKISLHASRYLPKKVIGIVENCQVLHEAFNYMSDICLSTDGGGLEGSRVFSEAIRFPPALLFFAYRTGECHISQSQWKLLRTLRQLCLTESTRSLVLFYLSEVLGPNAVEWVARLLHDLVNLPPYPARLQMGSGTATREHVRERSGDIEWNQVMGLLSESTTMLTLSSSLPVDRVEKKRLTKRVSRPANRKKDAPIITQDPFHEDLLGMWSFMRKEAESQRKSGGRSKPNGGRLVLPLSAQMEKGITARALAQEPEVVPPSLIGETWHSICLCTKDGNLTEYALFFIKDHVCCFNVENRSMNIPLQPMSKTLGLNSFPFMGGFDCAFNSPVNPRTAYFFCGEEWLEWDSYRQRCSGGLFKLRCHKQFRSLPEKFLSGINAAVPVANTPLVFFFCQLEYVVFNITERCLVGGPMRVGDHGKGNAGETIFGPSLSKVFPHGPMATMLMWEKSGETEESQEQEDNNNNNWASMGSIRSTREESLVGTTAKISANNNNGDGKGSSITHEKEMVVMLIGRCGRVATVKNFIYSPDAKCEVRFETIPSSVLSRLPMAFRQNTMTALGSICRTVLETECSVHDVILCDAHRSVHRECTVTSTLTQSAECAENLLSVVLPHNFTTVAPLLCESAVFVQTEESLLGEPSQTIEVRYDPMNPCAFGALVIVLNLSCIEPRVLQVAPVEVLLESSDDGIAYVRHAHFFITSSITPVCWGVSHVGCVWRVRFVSKLPVGTGVVRLLLYEVMHVVGTIPVDPTVALPPLESTLVTIDAPCLLSPARDILNCLTPGAVFTTSTSAGWFERHCILPLLPNGDFCLLFCGPHFVELDCSNGVVVGHRAVPIAAHPAFDTLPAPFLRGVNAAFYPNVRTPNIVAFISGSHVILWDIEKGAFASGGGGVQSAATMFKDLPWKMEEVENIVQIWSQPEEVFVIKSPHVLRWNIVTSELVEGPMRLSNSTYFRHPAFEGKKILCAASFPKYPTRFYTFCEDLVAALDVETQGITNLTEAKPVSQSEVFFPVTWYLRWGIRRHDCVINLDFKNYQKLLVGVTMQSSEPCDDNWVVECSDDGVLWQTVGRHHQITSRCRTIWGSERVGHHSRRFWRFSLECEEVDSRHEYPVLYFHMLLLTVSSVSSRVLPVRVACSGTLNGPMSSLFVDDKVTVAFENPVDESGATKVVRQHLIVDYGEREPSDVMEFSCICVGKPRPVMWIISCSSNGEQWEVCGTWHSHDHYFRAAWHPRGPRRFWSVELEAREQSTIYENLTFFEYTGPSVYLEDSLYLSCLLDPFVLCEVGSSGDTVANVVVPAEVGSSIVLDSKQDATQVVGVCMICHENKSPYTAFVVECSSDAVEWRGVGVTFNLRGNLAQAAWDVSDCCQYWRLRVTQRVGTSPLRICSIRFDTPKPTLYHHVDSKGDIAAGSSGKDLNLRGNCTEVVAVEAELPPLSSFVVEKRSVDGSSWQAVATLRNDDSADSRKVRQGWKPRGMSSHWRLRPVLAEDNLEETCFSSKSGPFISWKKECDVQAEWYSFIGKAFVRYDFSKAPDVKMAVEKFDEVRLPIFLSDNNAKTVVLRSRGMETEASVSWFFDSDTSPHFKQVFVNGRVETNPDAEAELEKLAALEVTSASSPRAPKKTGKKISKASTAQQEEIVKAIEMEEEVLVIVVETSNNGVDYVPVAERPFSPKGNSLSFFVDTPTSYWRVRFKGIPKASFLELFEVFWSLEKGARTKLSSLLRCPLSDSMYETWKNAAYSHEDEFCQQCRAGYDQARSVVSGLREPEDIEHHGRIAQYFMRFKSEYIAFQSKVFRNASKAKNLPDNKYISTERRSGNDFMYLLHAVAERYSCGVDKLNMLIANPMLVSRDFSIEKESVSWFYPKIVEGGTLAESFYGFHNARAFVIILWSMSLHVQRNTDLLVTKKINALNEHVASVMVLVEIKEINWLAIEHFPRLPLLYHVGFSGQPVLIAFTLNTLVFTPRYRLTFPGCSPLPLNHQMQLFPGVNFIRRTSLATCPCPIFDKLLLLYTLQFLENTKTEIILSAPTMDSPNATVRFTLPGNDINFGLRGLVIGYMVFEIELCMKATNVDPSEMALPVTEHKRINFVSYDTQFDSGEGTEPIIELTLAGSIGYPDEQILISGMSPSARYDIGDVFPDAFISDLSINFNAVLGHQPQSFLQPTVNLSGTLVVPACGSFVCRLQRVALNRNFESLSMEVSEMPLASLVTLSDKLVGSLQKGVDVSWMEGIPMYFSLELQLEYVERRLTGRGTFTLDGIEGDVLVTLSTQGFGATGNFNTVRIGAVCLQGKDERHQVLVNVASLANGHLSVRLDGYSYLFAPRPYPTRVEISQRGVVCISTGVFYDVCIEEDSIFPSKKYANVLLSKDLFSKCLEEELREIPLITALLAKGVEFSFVVDDVFAPQCMLERQLVFITVRGVLMGCYFDVTVPVTQPDNTVEEAKKISKELLPRVIEQCDMPLWALYHMFVGCVERCGSAASGGEGGDADDNNSDGTNLSVEGSASRPQRGDTSRRQCDGVFLSRWIQQERGVFEEGL